MSDRRRVYQKVSRSLNRDMVIINHDQKNICSFLLMLERNSVLWDEDNDWQGLYMAVAWGFRRGVSKNTILGGGGTPLQATALLYECIPTCNHPLILKPLVHKHNKAGNKSHTQDNMDTPENLSV